MLFFVFVFFFTLNERLMTVCHLFAASPSCIANHGSMTKLLCDLKNEPSGTSHPNKCRETVLFCFFFSYYYFFHFHSEVLVDSIGNICALPTLMTRRYWGEIEPIARFLLRFLRAPTDHSLSVRAARVGLIEPFRGDLAVLTHFRIWK